VYRALAHREQLVKRASIMVEYLFINKSGDKKVRVIKYRIFPNTGTLDITFDKRAWNKNWDNDVMWMYNLKDFFEVHKNINQTTMMSFSYSQEQKDNKIQINVSQEFIDEWKAKGHKYSSGGIYHQHQW
jgi:hypothetical protein